MQGPGLMLVSAARAGAVATEKNNNAVTAIAEKAERLIREASASEGVRFMMTSKPGTQPYWPRRLARVKPIFHPSLG